MNDDWDFDESGGGPSKTLTSLYGGDAGEDEEEIAPKATAKNGKQKLRLRKEFNFVAETEARKFDKIKGLNEGKLEEEIKKYAEPMDGYAVPDLDEYEADIATWNLELPEQDCTDEAELAITYHRLNNYMIRINQMLREAKAYLMVTRTAYDHLMDVAQKVYPGTGPEKKGSASYRLQAFFEAKNQAEFVAETLTDWARVLDKMHFRLRDGMEHLRSAARVNRSWNVYGESASHERVTGAPDPEDEPPTQGAPSAPSYGASMSRYGGGGGARILGSAAASRTSLEGRMRTRRSPSLSSCKKF
jgi:hypothetical protein